MTNTRVEMEKHVKNLVVDTNAFINSAPIQDVGESVLTIQEVIDEVTSKRQLRHLSVLSYDLKVKDVFLENIQFVTEFSKKTGDYLSLSATDIKVIALTYQLEKECCGSDHLSTEPKLNRFVTTKPPSIDAQKPSLGFFQPPNKDNDKDTVKHEDEDDLGKLECGLKDLQVSDEVCDTLLAPVQQDSQESDGEEDVSEESEEDDDSGWITVTNIEQVKKDINSDLVEEEITSVACMTADFAMQNVLKQIGLKVASYDGRIIRRMQTFILRCTTCFKTTSVMTKVFCPNCGHKNLKKVGVSVDENGEYKIHINSRKPLTARGKRFSLPAPKGGAHANNPVLTEDQPRARQKSSKLARMKNNPLNADYIAGYSPFIMRDVNSKSAVLGVRNATEVKNWMRKNPNEVRRKRK